MSVLSKIDENISELNRQLNWSYYARMFVLSHLETFDLLPDATIAGNKIDFDRLSHDQVIQVIKSFPGRWRKEPNGVDGSRVDYSITLRNNSKTTELCEIVIRCWAGEPPPNCQIVYEDVLVPAQTVKRAKMICADRPELNGHAPPPAIEAEVISELEEIPF